MTHRGHESGAEASEVGALDREVEEEGRQPGAFEAQADLATGIRTTHRLISRCMLTWMETRSWGRPRRRLSPGKILLMPSWKVEVRGLVEAAATHSVREREQEDGEAEGDVVPKEEEKISQQLCSSLTSPPPPSLPSIFTAGLSSGLLGSDTARRISESDFPALLSLCMLPNFVLSFML